MALEQGYLAALGDVREAAIDGDQLVLTGDGIELRFDPLEAPEPAALIGTPWLLDAVLESGGPDGSASSPVGEPATLELSDDGTLTGSTGCNSFSGTYELSEDTLTASDLVSTRIACAEEIAKQETAVLTVLTGPAAVAIDGETLTLTGPHGSGLVYRVAEAKWSADPGNPTTSAAGWWQLREGTSDGEPIEVGDHQITLELTATSLFANVGCNEIAAEVVFDGATITPAEPGGGLSGTDMLCEGLMELEAAYRNALSLPLSYEQSGDQLVLRGDHGELTFDRLTEPPTG
jgi:heat shock protein HslJ